MTALVQLWSVMIMIESYPSEVGNLMMKSTAIVWNGSAASSGTIGCIGGLFLCMIGLFAWQIAHPLTYCLMNSLHPGHQYCLSNILCVLSIPGCAAVRESWFSLTKSLHIFSSSDTIRAIPLWYLPALSCCRLCFIVHSFRVVTCCCCSSV